VVSYAFDLGLANFGKGLVRSPREIAAAVGEVVPLVAWYGPTGNLALRDVDAGHLRRTLPDITGTEWAVVSAEDLDRALAALGGLAEPAHALDERPTAGLAFQATARHPAR
jgi:hypothetical protein